MPTLDYPWNPVLSGNVRTPILGNDSRGAAARLPDGRGLWVALVGGEWTAWRTRGSASELVRFDNSVERVATILSDPAGPIVAPAQAALTWIDGTLYANINGKRVGDPGHTYARIMRDTSTAKDGSGPWVTHGLLPTDAARNVPSSHFSGEWGGCEIVTNGSTWATLHPIWSVFDDRQSAIRMGISSSNDAGGTWANRVNQGFYAAGIYGLGGSRNIARWQGKWYVGGWGNVSRGYHFSSPDLTTWVELGGLDMGINSHGRSFPVADASRLWSLPTRNPVDVFDFAPLQATSDATPGSSWTTVVRNVGVGLNLSTYQQVPFLTDIGSEVRHLWAACGGGRIRALSPIEPPVTRLYPRTDGRGLSSASRHVGGVPRSRIVGGHP